VVQHISAEEIGESEDESAQLHIKPSVFDRLQPSTSRKCPFVFSSIGRGQNPKSYVFWRVKNHAQSRPLMFNKIIKARESSNPLPQEQKDSVFNRPGNGNNLQSFTPSGMKRLM